MASPSRRPGSRIAPWLLALVVSACSTATLPYKPESPPTGSSLSADYVLLADRLRVELDTGGYRLEDAQIVRADGTAVRPLTIESPAPSGGGSSVGFGVGVGSSSYGRGSSVGVGTGIGVGIPLGADTRVQGNTLLYFALDQVGPPPWRLFLKAAETAPATIVLPPR